MDPASTGHRVRVVALVAAGGALGSLLRYGLDLWVPGWPPLGTLAANGLGAFLLGVVLYEPHFAGRFSPATRLLVGTGFCGSLSTYSTFAAETATADPAIAGPYVVGTYGLSVAAILAGRGVVRWRP
jgi:CrcB protein